MFRRSLLPVLFLAILGWLNLGYVSVALADDVDIVTSFSDVGEGAAQTYEHEDAEPFKGWVNLQVTNTGGVAWGDFHFEIMDLAWDITNVDFIVSSPYEPTSSQSPLTWIVDNDAYGATLDLFYFSDPVNPGDTATFTVYTDNTVDQVPFFGILLYPTPVPEPTSLVLLGVGALLVRRRTR